MTVLLCPLCSQPRFHNLESLRSSLVNAATQSISCPICSEILKGLDKLTIHLFGHTFGHDAEKRQCLELKITNSEKPSSSNLLISTSENSFPKETVKEKVSDNAAEYLQNHEKPKEFGPSTVNVEDLSFLTSWENSFRTDDLKDPEPSKEEAPVQEENSSLSEYMSELLNKKLPALNFVNTTNVSEIPEEKPVEKSEEFKCPACDFSFRNSIILSMHQELVHSKPEKSEGPEEVPDLEALKDLIMPRYNCHLCSKSFKMKGSLLVHYRVGHLDVENAESYVGNQSGMENRNFHCSICNKSFKKGQHLTQHIKTHEGKQWQCETCNKHFTTKYFLKKHRRLHTGEMPYSCRVCNKTFTFQQSYHKHLLYHSDEKPHQCSQCGRSFKELSTLHNHQRIHSGEKPFACETCGKCFRQRVSYIVHQRIHTGVLPYQCTACKKKFRYKVSQRSHKCAAQPPGIVVRQPEDFIQKILEQF